MIGSRRAVAAVVSGGFFAAACGISLVGTSTDGSVEADGSADAVLDRAPSEEASVDDAALDGVALDAGCDADFSADPANCGACGIDCLGGGCDAGRCAPVIVASGTSPRDVRVSGTSVYWVDDTAKAIYLTDLADGGTQPFIGDAGEAWSIEVTSTHVYWGTFNPKELWRRKLDRSAPAERLSTGILGALSLASDGTIFQGDYYNSRILRLDPAASSWTGVFLANVPSPWGVHARATELLVPITGDGDGTKRGPIRRYDLADAGLRDAAVDDADSPQTATSDATYVYYSSWYGNAIYRARLDETLPPEILYGGIVKPEGVAIAGRVLYFAGGANVYRAALPP